MRNGSDPGVGSAEFLQWGKEPSDYGFTAFPTNDRTVGEIYRERICIVAVLPKHVEVSFAQCRHDDHLLTSILLSMKMHAARWCLLIPVFVLPAFAQAPLPASESISELHRERISLYESINQGAIESALANLNKRPVPDGMIRDVFVARELCAVGFAAINRDDSATAARAAQEVVARLSFERIRSFSTRSDRVAGYRLIAQLYGRVLADQPRSREAWAALLLEQPEDEQAQAAIRKYDQQAEVRAKRQGELARDPMKKGFIPVAAPKP